MARKYITREITKTTVKVARMEVQDGKPVAVPMEDETIVGNVSVEQAQRQIKKKLGDGVTVFGVQANTEKYKMAVADFLQLATLVTDENSDDSEDESDDEDFEDEE